MRQILLVAPRAFTRGLGRLARLVKQRIDAARSAVREALDDRFPRFGPPRLA